MRSKATLTNLIFASLFLSIFAQAQTTSKANCTQFPVVPVMVEYQQSSLFFRQWISGNPHYAEINAFVGEGEKPILQLVLVEKDRRESFYSNDGIRVKELIDEGKQAYFVPVDFKKIAGGVDAQPTYGFGFEDKHKQKILWRFIPASRPSERGAGLTPLTNVPGLRLFYRNLGTLAGAGTSVRIGDKEFEAEPWTEASTPPFFVAYRGSITEGLEAGNLRLGEENWRLTACPKELKEGEAWDLIESGGRKLTLRISSRHADELIIDEVIKDSMKPARLRLVALTKGRTLALRAIERGNNADGIRISFTPDLSLSAANEVEFQIKLGNHKNIANGTVSVEEQGDALILKWQFKSPDWAKNKKPMTLIKTNLSGYTIKIS